MDLQELQALTTSGVVQGYAKELNVIIGDSFSNTVAIIDTGMAFFSDSRAVITITEPEFLPIEDEVVNFIYVVHDDGPDPIRPEGSTTEPSGNFVMLAKVEADGTLEDLRVFAE